MDNLLKEQADLNLFIERNSTFHSQGNARRSFKKIIETLKQQEEEIGVLLKALHRKESREEVICSAALEQDRLQLKIIQDMEKTIAENDEIMARFREIHGKTTKELIERVRLVNAKYDFLCPNSSGGRNLDMITRKLRRELTKIKNQNI